MQEAYKEIGSVSLEITEKLAEEVISLPVQPLLSEEQIRFVVSTIEKFYQ